MRLGSRVILGIAGLLVLATIQSWAEPMMAGLGGGPREGLADTPDRLATEVVSILRRKCVGCHGEDARDLRGGFDVRTRDALAQGGESGEPAVVSGRPEASPLYRAVTREDPSLAMPPKANDRLTAEEVARVRLWIEQGAPWPASSAASKHGGSGQGIRVPTSGGLGSDWTNRAYKGEDLWAFRPLGRPAVPATRSSVSNPIDAFLGERLDAIGLVPAPRSVRQMLIRRATFDLIGLPPTPEEVDDFLADPASDAVAFARVVDRLLASPLHGERWAQHWLDLVRYADSAGMANDYDRGSAWRYRDYVARAFNADTPFDAFATEQIAGDEIEPSTPESLVALGFLRMGPWELTGMEVAKVARQRFLDDVTDLVGQVFLAQPLQCARCHDHKFDPIPTRDYYAIQAVFATTQIAERPVPFVPGENTSGFDERRFLALRAARHREMLERIERKEEAAAREWCVERGLPYVSRALGLRQGVAESRLPPARIGLDPVDLGLERIARKGLERIAWESDRYLPFAHSVYSGPTPALRSIQTPLRMPSPQMPRGALDSTAILAGGDPFAPRERVVPGVLSVLSTLGRAPTPSIPQGAEGRRAAFARWLVAPANPLTPRVVVNRVWQGHFGKALAGNPNNLGATGKKPTHPELLDWLAREFLDRGWSVKAIHRLIMTSDAYQRASLHPDRDDLERLDPDRVTLAVFPDRRLSAEEIRDAMLSASGELRREIGGIPVRPEVAPAVALQPRMVMGTYAPAWQASPRPDQRHRRTFYALRLRGLRDPLLEVFDQPSLDASCEKRETSTIAPQSLSQLNGEATRGRALALAARVLRETKTPRQAIDRAYRLALGRRPSPAETETCLTHWERMTERHRDHVLPRTTRPREVVREAVEENTGESFSFVETLDQVAEFVPDLEPADVDARVRGLMEVALVIFNTNEFLTLD